MTRATETSDKDFVVLIDEVQATVVGHEGGDLLTVLDELNTAALTDSGVRLLGLNTELLNYNALGVGSSAEGVGLPDSAKVGLLVLKVGPSLLSAVSAQLAGGLDTARLAVSVW